jgi:hypothetical protein
MMAGWAYGLWNAGKNCILHITTDEAAGRLRMPSFEPPYRLALKTAGLV